MNGNVFFKDKKIESINNLVEMIEKNELEYFITEEKKLGRLF